MTMAEQRTVPLAIISPVRDEAKLLRGTIESIVAQTCLPQEWLLVDDGSTDETPDIIQEYAEKYPFIRMVKKEDRGKRLLGSGVIHAFNFGRENLADDSYEYIVKLDGDLTFGPKYIETMVAELEANPKLAAVSGKVFRPEGDGYVEEYHIDEMVCGQFKFYRRTAFDEIGGFPSTILWDGIDMHKCRLAGWETKSFHHPDARVIHHRLMGSSDKNVYKGRVRLGKGIWFMGYHPLYATASGLFRMHEKPYVVGGAIIIGAYFSAALKGEERFDDPEFREQLQKWQLNRLAETIKKPGKYLKAFLPGKHSEP